MQSMSARLMKAALMMAALPAATAMAGAMARISRTTPLVQSPRCASPVAVGELVQAAAEMPDYSNAVLPVVAGASALFAGAGLAFRNGAADSATNDASEVAHDVVEEVKEVAEAVIEEWPSVGGGSGIHRGAGRYPAPPPRELWTPPPGWTPPRKPVISWYDRGIRLQPEVKTAAAPTATAAKEESKPSPQSFFAKLLSGFPGQPSASATPAPDSWPSVGGGSGIHRGAGRYPAPPPRELWTPPPGWTPPTKKVTVVSWYDSGKRL